MVVVILTSLTETPVIAPPGSFIPVLVVELIWSPRTVTFVFSVTVLPRFVTVALPLFITGKDGLLLGGVRPVMVESEAVASCPINFCPLSNVTAPVYWAALS